MKICTNYGEIMRLHQSTEEILINVTSAFKKGLYNRVLLDIMAIIQSWVWTCYYMHCIMVVAIIEQR